MEWALHWICTVLCVKLLVMSNCDLLLLLFPFLTQQLALQPDALLQSISSKKIILLSTLNNIVYVHFLFITGMVGCWQCFWKILQQKKLKHFDIFGIFHDTRKHFNVMRKFNVEKHFRPCEVYWLPIFMTIQYAYSLA